MSRSEWADWHTRLVRSVASGHDAGPTIDLSVAAQLRRSGQGKRMVIGDPYQAASDASLVDVLKEAVAARQKLLADTDETLNEITERTTKSKGRLTALMRLSYLAPDIIADILGRPAAAGAQREAAAAHVARPAARLAGTSGPSWGSPDENRLHGSRRVPDPPAPIVAT